MANPKNDEKKDFNKWLDKVYDLSLLSDAELKTFYDNAKYSGFNRDEMLSKLFQIVGNYKLTAESVIVCALRGPVKAADIKLSNGKTLRQMGVSPSGQKGTMNLSCARISASTADLAAFYLKRLDVPKRHLDSDLPGWLQFPTAGSIKLPDNYRRAHIEFSKKFSEQIKGKFDESIYSQMMANAYLDPKIKDYLFKD